MMIFFAIALGFLLVGCFIYAMALLTNTPESESTINQTDQSNQLERAELLHAVHEVGLLICRAEEIPDIWKEWTETIGTRDEIALHFLEIYETNPEVIDQVNSKIGQLLEKQRIELENLESAN